MAARHTGGHRLATPAGAQRAGDEFQRRIQQPDESGAESGRAAVGHVFVDSGERLHQISGFAQDSWKIHSRLSATFGVWLLSALPPHLAPGANLYSVDESSGNYALIGGAPIRHGNWLNFDPALSIAWRISDWRATTLRASWTSFHDGDFGVATDQLNGSPYLSLQSPQNVIFNGVNLLPVSWDTASLPTCGFRYTGAGTSPCSSYSNVGSAGPAFIRQ